jgi:hypothetical protein
MKLGMKSKQDQERMTSDNEKEGLRIGADISRSKADMDLKHQQLNKPKGAK